MARDLIYYFDKKTFQRFELGEIQSDFNMSFVIDGTKDSTRLEIFSFNGIEIEPYTIIWHEKTNTWWVVSHDRVNRMLNERGFAYTHELDLLGAIELLNARDLTDCGFNDNTYSVQQFIERLFTLSNFEYPIYFDSSISANFLAKKVEYIKTFENYTLLSAIREFLDGYNQAAKLTFDTSVVNNQTFIYYARINIIPKTGNLDRTYNIDDFDDTREIKTIDHNSFGTCVVSNAENVISTEHKTYPSVGSVKLSSTENIINSSNAIVRLPSKVFKGNWIKIVSPFILRIRVTTGQTPEPYEETFRWHPYSDCQIDLFITEVCRFARGVTDDNYEQALRNQLNLFKDSLESDLNKSGTITLFDGNKITTYFGQNNDQQGVVRVIKGDNVPYMAKVNDLDMGFFTKDEKGLLPNTKQGVAWERGSNIISGFDILSSQLEITSLLQTDLQENITTFFAYNLGSYTTQIEIEMDGSILLGRMGDISVIVDYIPMTDLKIKLDNQRDKRDIQLYNQNGRITDNVALSKLLNSYVKEISSDNITRYKQYYDFDNVPKVGDIVLVGNDYYVVSNLSLDFKQNETFYPLTTFGYFIDCEITMCKYVVTKSLMTNPNSNIRDYGIPQNFNVKRKQLYRDYYELAYETYSDANQETPYYDFHKIFYFGTKTTEISDFIGVIKLSYNEQVENAYDWYYQLDTTRYDLDKTIYMVLDFNDNNIIGYGSQNVFSGFDITRIFRGFTDVLNAPITYVDNNGNVKDISIMFCSNEQLTSIYSDYQIAMGGQTYKGSLYNYSVFIPQEIYDSALNNHEIAIVENDYNKDAIEVPVFEYACQIGDSKDVIIGDNILTQRENSLYFYSFVVGDNLTPNNVAPTQNVVPTSSPVGWRIQGACRFEIIEDVTGHLLLGCYLHSYARYNASTLLYDYGNNVNVSVGRDMAIFRHAVNLTTGVEEQVDLMFIARKMPNDHISSNRLILDINHYKLK